MRINLIITSCFKIFFQISDTNLIYLIDKNIRLRHDQNSQKAEERGLRLAEKYGLIVQSNKVDVVCDTKAYKYLIRIL